MRHAANASTLSASGETELELTTIDSSAISDEIPSHNDFEDSPSSIARRPQTPMAMSDSGSTDKQVDHPQVRASRWRWNDEMVETLISCLHDNKVKKDFEGKDMEADLVELYEDIRVMMASLYPTGDFGPSEPSSAEDRRYAKVGYLRIKDKVKQIRCIFKKAVVEGTRSGSGKLIVQHWDLLSMILGPSFDDIGWLPISLEDSGGYCFNT